LKNTSINKTEIKRKEAGVRKWIPAFYKLKIAPYARYFLERGLHKYIEILSERTAIWS